MHLSYRAQRAVHVLRADKRGASTHPEQPWDVYVLLSQSIGSGVQGPRSSSIGAFKRRDGVQEAGERMRRRHLRIQSMALSWATKKAPLVSVCPPPDSWPRRLVSLNSKAIDLTLEGCEKIRMTRCKRKYPLLLAGSERSAHNTTYSASFGVWSLPSRRRGLTCSLGLEVDRIRWVARDTFSSLLERRREVDGSPHNRSRRADPALRIRLEFHDS